MSGLAAESAPSSGCRFPLAASPQQAGSHRLQHTGCLPDTLLLRSCCLTPLHGIETGPISNRSATLPDAALSSCGCRLPACWQQSALHTCMPKRAAPQFQVPTAVGLLHSHECCCSLTLCCECQALPTYVGSPIVAVHQRWTRDCVVQ